MRTITGYKQKNSQATAGGVDRANVLNQFCNRFDTAASVCPAPGSTALPIVASTIPATASPAHEPLPPPPTLGRLGHSVPGKGKKYVMYHGTTKENAQAIQTTGFRQSADGMLGCGVYLSRDLQKASHYPTGHPESDKVVIQVVVNVGKVIIINPLDSPMLHTDTNMDQQLQWAEDDFDVPEGVGRLGLSEPVSGKTYVMYHGTTRKNAESIQATGFRQSEDGMLGRGIYLSRDLQKASRYPIGHPESDRVVIKVLVNVGKVIVINYQGHPRQKTWHDHGYDTAWVPPKCGMVRSGLEEDCVWDPSQIKITSTIRPRPIQSPRPVQSSSSLGAWGYSDYCMPCQHRLVYYEPWMQPWFGMGQSSMFDSDSDISLKQPVTVEKNVKSRGPTKKKEKQSDSDISLKQPVTVEKNVKSRGPTKKKEKQSDSGVKVIQQYLWTENDDDPSDRLAQLSLSEPVTGKKNVRSRGPTKKKK
ncbi:uncharacterized protein ABDE67_012595 [Symphorus nematophorus]